MSFNLMMRSQSWIVKISYRDAVFMKLEMASTLTKGRPGSDISFTNSVTLDLFKLQMSMGDKELASMLDMK